MTGTDADRSPASRTAAMKLLSSAYWIIVAAISIPVALSFFHIRVSHEINFLMVTFGILIMGIVLLYGLFRLGREYQWDWSRWD
jgi:hypothetical protein